MRVVVWLPGPLREYVGGAKQLPLDVTDSAVIRDVLDAVGRSHPLLERRIRDELGQIREHVNVFVGTDNIKDLDRLETRLHSGVEITILPAVSGGARHS